MNLCLYVAAADDKIPADVLPATIDDLAQTKSWQTSWLSKEVSGFPNKVALKRRDNGELLGLMSYAIDESISAVEVVYLESAAHSNANLLGKPAQKRYLGIARALLAYAANQSLESGFDGIVVLKAKTTKLREYYMREFGALPVGRHNPFQLVIWDDAAQVMISGFMEGE